MASDEVLNHLQAGKVVTKLKLAFEDQLSFILQDNMQIKSLRLEDLLREQAVKDGGDDAASQFTATLVLSILTLPALLPNRFEALGGEELAGAIEAAVEPIQSAAASSELALLDAAERFVTERKAIRLRDPAQIQGRIKLGGPLGRSTGGERCRLRNG
ncbi:recombination-associated protein RdgC [Pseudomonas putida]|uniref:Recombination-associated protein RdgC n=1 Tax=Pseudomonas putida TaxID=303 RepID=A0A7Y7ZF73_PSEPU|nr:recombination-associated protein RdgC [Pseudomonas putida]NWC83881.1 recombination-associated protein RdgC [Pseudomonas putida]